MADKTILVTGGSRGIGRAIVELAASQGYAAAFTYVEGADAAHELERGIAASGQRCLACRHDSAAGATEVQALFEKVEAELGPITHLVNNVGITGRMGPLVDLPEDVLRRTVDVNLVGTILMTQATVRRWLKSGTAGSVVNVSSVAATLGAPGEYVHYAATKAAIEAFTVGLSKELGPQGIRVNVVSPGTTETEIHARGGDPGRLDRVAPRVPLGRVGQPADIAEAIMWLHSPAASYVTGATLRVGGGL